MMPMQNPIRRRLTNYSNQVQPEEDFSDTAMMDRYGGDGGPGPMTGPPDIQDPRMVVGPQQMQPEMNDPMAYPPGGGPPMAPMPYGEGMAPGYDPNSMPGATQIHDAPPYNQEHLRQHRQDKIKERLKRFQAGRENMDLRRQEGIQKGMTMSEDDAARIREENRILMEENDAIRRGLQRPAIPGRPVPQQR